MQCIDQMKQKVTNGLDHEILKNSFQDDWRTYSNSFYSELILKRNRFIASNVLLTFIAWCGLLGVIFGATYVFMGTRPVEQILKGNLFPMTPDATSQVHLVSLNVFMVFLLYQVYLCFGNKSITWTIRSDKTPDNSIRNRNKVINNNFNKCIVFCFIDSLLFVYLVYTTGIGYLVRSISLLGLLIPICVILILAFISRMSYYKFFVYATLICILLFALPFYNPLIKDYSLTTYFKHDFGTSAVSLFVIWVLSVFLVIPFEILVSKRSRHNVGKTIAYSLIYWKYFTGALVKNDLVSSLGILWFAASSLLASRIIGKAPSIESLATWAYLSTYFASIVVAFAPILKAFHDVRSLIVDSFDELIVDKVVRHLQCHIILIGLSDIGRGLARNTFNKIHGGNVLFESAKNRGFELLIDDKFDINIVSTNIVIVDKNEKNFKLLKSRNPDYSIGLFRPFEGYNVQVVSVCGDSMHPSVMQAVNTDHSSLIINTLSDHHISMFLSKRVINTKLILSTFDTPSFDTVVSQGIEKPLFPFNASLIEGISISQRIIQHIMKQIEDPIMEYSASLDKLTALNKVILIGEGKIIYYIIHSFMLSCLSELKSEEATKELCESLFYVVSTDSWFYDELSSCSIPDKESFHFLWSFYPQRNESISDLDLYNVNFLKLNTANYESFMILFRYLSEEDKEPGLVVFLNNKEHQSASMICRAINALISLKSTITDFRSPQIIASCHYNDRSFVYAQVMKYISLNNEAIKIDRYPLNHPKDAIINRDMVSTNQLSTLVKALFEVSFPRKASLSTIASNTNGFVTELSFCVDDSVGSFFALLCSILGFKWKRPSRKDLLIPSFSYCYTFNDRFYDNSFIFTGTACLRQVGGGLTESGTYNANAWAINCENNKQNRTIIAQISDLCSNITKHTETNRQSNRKLSDCMISAHSMHSYMNTNTHYMINDNCLALRGNSNGTLPHLPEQVHFKVWASDNDVPGALALALSDLMLCQMDSFVQGDLIPSIEFTNSIPCGLTGKALISLYTRFYDTIGRQSSCEQIKKAYKITEKGDTRCVFPIIAVKIKLSRTLRKENDQWVIYSHSLLSHLNTLISQDDCINSPRYIQKFVSYVFKNHLQYIHIYNSDLTLHSTYCIHNCVGKSIEENTKEVDNVESELSINDCSEIIIAQEDYFIKRSEPATKKIQEGLRRMLSL